MGLSYVQQRNISVEVLNNLVINMFGSLGNNKMVVWFNHDLNYLSDTNKYYIQYSTKVKR